MINYKLADQNLFIGNNATLETDIMIGSETEYIFTFYLHFYYGIIQIMI